MGRGRVGIDKRQSKETYNQRDRQRGKETDREAKRQTEEEKGESHMTLSPPIWGSVDPSEELEVTEGATCEKTHKQRLNFNDIRQARSTH